MYLSHLIRRLMGKTPDNNKILLRLIDEYRCFLYSFLNFMEVLFITKERENPINEQIRAKEMMVIGPNGEQLGIKSKQDALTLAKYAGFDLVLMSENANPAVCKIMDYNRFRYEKKKKAKEAMKKQREAIVDIKEYRLSITIDIHDFNTRVKNARKSLEKGDKVKASIKFKGRQISHPELGKDVLIRFSNELSDIADVEIQPKMEGKSIYMQLTPKK